MAHLKEGDTDTGCSYQELITKGRRDLVCMEVQSAVENFQKACELIASKNGDFHESLAVPNLLYGTALLELARSENQILGAGVANASDESDAEQAGAEVEENKSINSSAGCSDTEEQPPSGVQESKEGEGASVDNSDAEKHQEVSDDESDGEVSTLQLAWEVIEVAKALFQKHDCPEHQLKVSDCLEKLAEISCEKEDHEQAINDLLESLELRLKFAPDNERLIAETHFQLGVAYSLLGNVISANASFASALECLKKHNEKLKAQIEKHYKDAELNKSEIEQLNLQVKEVEQIIAEVEERRKENFESSTVKASEDQKSVGLLTKPSIPPASDISHLIKKKRPVSDNIEEDAKKVKLDASEQSGKPVEIVS